MTLQEHQDALRALLPAGFEIAAEDLLVIRHNAKWRSKPSVYLVHKRPDGFWDYSGPYGAVNGISWERLLRDLRSDFEPVSPSWYRVNYRALLNLFALLTFVLLLGGLLGAALMRAL